MPATPTDAEIRAALLAELATVPGFPDAAHRALENEIYEPEPDELYARVSLLFAREQAGSLPAHGATVWRSGMLALVLDFPIDRGITERDPLVQALRNVFPPEHVIAVAGRGLKVRIFDPHPGYRDGHRWLVPVDITWRIRAVNPST